ncbi:MAG: hypothetical protein ACK5HY_04510 [Parahaliea sp.]
MLLALICAPTLADPANTRSAHHLLQSRCMVCHGCYDAPCQLKLEAQTGLARGASQEPVYEGTRLLAANLTRLFDDASSIAVLMTGEKRAFSR